MTSPSSTSFWSPERIACAFSFLALLALGAYAWLRFCQPSHAPQTVAVPQDEFVAENKVKTDYLRWCAPVTSIRYRDSPFTISLSLKSQPKPQSQAVPERPAPAPIAATAQTLKQASPTPVPKPDIYLIQYRGHYTNLSGVHYAMLTISKPSTHEREDKVMVARQTFLRGVQLADFNDAYATIRIRDRLTMVIPWNETRELKLSPSCPAAMAPTYPRHCPSPTNTKVP